MYSVKRADLAQSLAVSSPYIRRQSSSRACLLLPSIGWTQQLPLAHLAARTRAHGPLSLPSHIGWTPPRWTCQRRRRVHMAQRRTQLRLPRRRRHSLPSVPRCTRHSSQRAQSSRCRGEIRLESIMHPAPTPIPPVVHPLAVDHRAARCGAAPGDGLGERSATEP